MKELIKKYTLNCERNLRDIKSRLYDNNGKMRLNISEEYLSEKEFQILEEERRLRALNHINKLTNDDMIALLLDNYTRNSEGNAIITAFFTNGKKVVYRGCLIDMALSTNNILVFESDYGRGWLNINNFATISISYYNTTYDKHINELLENNGTRIKPLDVKEVISDAISEVFDMMDNR